MSWDMRPNETEYEYIYRLGQNKEAIGTWQDIADIINKALGYEYTECRYRKMYAAFKKMFEANEHRLVGGSNVSTDMAKQKVELEKERKKIQAEKIEYTKWIREDARDELIVEKIVDAINNLEPIDFPEAVAYSDDSEHEYVLMFGDEHYGAEFCIKGLRGEIINEYSPEIFEKRMEDLLNKTLNIVFKEDISTLHIFSMGDFADGVLRVGQLTKLRYGVVESTIHYMEFIANWLNELSKYVHIKYHSVNGNHTELRFFNQPKGAFTDENMGKVVDAYLDARLAGNKNIELVRNQSGMIFENIAGFNVLGIHGEVKDVDKALKDISVVYHEDIDYLCCGHLHHSSYEDVGVRKGVIRVPSIIGTDDFALKLRKTSQAGATLVEFTQGLGKTIEYTIGLN